MDQLMDGGFEGGWGGLAVRDGRAETGVEFLSAGLTDDVA